MVVHLEDPPEAEGFARPDPRVAGIVDDHGVGLAEVGDRAQEDAGRSTDEGGIVEAQQDHLLVGALLESGPGDPLVEPHRPVHSRHALHAEELRVGKRLDVVDELDVGIHDPDARPLDVADLAHRERHEPAEDR